MQQHEESRTKVFYTKDYTRFSKITGNRDLNANKIKKMKADIESGLDILRYCPILVAEKEGKLEIIDGQHRFNVSRILKSHVWYVMVDELTLSEIARINSNQEKWKTKDFINCYVENKNEHYIGLNSFIEKYQLPLAVSLQCLTNGLNIKAAGGGLIMDSFYTGKFEIKMAKEAEVLGDSVIQFSKFKLYKQRAFCVAIAKILAAKKIDLKELIAAINKNPDRLEPQINEKGYILNLEVIMNIGKHSRIIIF